MAKLTGEAYRNYWRSRIAKGADQVSFNGRDADRQGDDIWRFIREPLSELNPRSVLDFGCGYGRMLRKLHALFPVARLYGVDICQPALDVMAQDKNWVECGKPKLATKIRAGLHADLVFDCMALQHVTDNAVFAETVESFRKALAKHGAIVLFENVAQPGADHVRDMTAEDYMALWPELQWENHGVLMLWFQGHALLVGRK